MVGCDGTWLMKYLEIFEFPKLMVQYTFNRYQGAQVISVA